MFMSDMQIPINPERITTKIPTKNETIDLLNAGEVNVLRNPGLTEISFNFMLPNSKYPFSDNLLGYRKASYYIDRLEMFKSSKQPFQFIIVRMKPNGDMLGMTNIKVTLEDYTIEDDATEGFDLYASVDLKKWIPYGTKTLEVKTDKDGNTTGTVTSNRPTDKVPSPTAKAGIGQTLQHMVKSQFGNTNNLFAIAAVNKVAVPAILTAGQIYKMSKG